MKKPAVVFHAAPTSRAAPATGLAAASVLTVYGLLAVFPVMGIALVPVERWKSLVLSEPRP